jgi:hypothetical protein
MAFETKQLRDINKTTLKNLDDNLKFYYDETNNIRRFYLKEEGFNEPIKTNFVLGVYSGSH